MKLVIIESPYAANALHTVEDHVRYARAAVRDALLRGEAPFASHLIYTQPGIFDDLVPAEREAGILAGLELAKRADLTAVYLDLGVSSGMSRGIAAAEKAGRPWVSRTLPGWTR